LYADRAGGYAIELDGAVPLVAVSHRASCVRSHRGHTVGRTTSDKALLSRTFSQVRGCLTNCPRLRGYAGLDTANAVWVHRPSGVQIPEPPPLSCGDSSNADLLLNKARQMRSVASGISCVATAAVTLAPVRVAAACGSPTMAEATSDHGPRACTHSGGSSNDPLSTGWSCLYGCPDLPSADPLVPVPISWGPACLVLAPALPSMHLV
jgi:hypothetical protein